MKIYFFENFHEEDTSKKKFDLLQAVCVQSVGISNVQPTFESLSDI